MKTTTKGFTVIELVFIIVIVATASVIFFVQKNTIEVAARDETRKTAINAMYYGLEEVYYEENKSYPRTIDSKIIRSVDPELFTDPFNVPIGDAESNYRYEATNCTDDDCKSYTLRASLENEDDYIKKNRTR
jgi:type II secretory pathway pseudopilin PulG